MEYLPLIIQLASGALGGNLAAKAIPQASMGVLINSILGIAGGGLGGQVLSAMGLATGGGMDLMGIIGAIASGGVGGGIIMALIGLLKNALKR
jgi:uncharacterized membrane protein YeaQ/YmgE (transglycosylase-associated protein family)